MKRVTLVVLTLVCSIVSAQTPSFTPGPTLTMGAFVASKPQPDRVSWAINGQTQPNDCVIFPAVGGATCARCDLSKTRFSGQVSITATSHKTGLDSATSAPLVATGSEQCGKANVTTGAISCTWVFTPAVPPTYPANDPCLPSPPVPQQGWTATGGTIFKFSGGRLTAPTVRKATKGAQCDGSTVVTAGAFVYQGLVGGAADEKTACEKL